MSSKAISSIYEAHKVKQPPGEPYVQVDIDRLIGHLKSEVLKMDQVLNDPEGRMFDDHPSLRHHFEAQMDAYAGLLSMIESNSFK